VDVHVDQAGHQVLPTAVDAEDGIADGHLGRRPDCRDPAVSDKHALVFDDALPVEWDQGDVDEHSLGALRWGRAGQER
jgi:hypothetical protein